MNKRLTTMAMAVITMLVMPISAFAQLDDGDKINVFAISQQMQGRGLLSLVHMINVDNNMGQQEINSMLNFDIQGGAVTPPKNQDSRQHFLTEAFARDDGNEQWNQIRFQDYDRGNAIYTREFAVKTDCTIDFRIGAGSPVIEERLPFMRNGYTSMAADGSIFLWVTIDDPRCSGGAADSGGGAQGPQGKQGPAGADGAAGAAGAAGADGAAGAAGADGADGAAGADGADGADEPCVPCATVANGAVDLACLILGEDPPSSVEELQADAEIIANTFLISVNICDEANCDVDAEIQDAVNTKLGQ